MKKATAILLSVVVFLFSLFACTATQNSSTVSAKAYAPTSPTLYDTIAYMDSVLFDTFNTRDLDKLKTLFSEDLEFYHDKGGLDNYKQTIEKFRILFERNKTTGLRRDIVKGSLEVYPIKDYGAVETCLHRFCHVENGKDDCGTFKNIMLWQRKDGQWKVTRVISYDH